MSAKFDPLSLPESPLSDLVNQFEYAWSFGERMRNMSHGALPMGESLYEDYRQSHLIIAHALVKDPKLTPESGCYFTIQDEQQSFCIFINAFDKPRAGPDHEASFGKPVDSSMSGAVLNPPGPIIPVRYAMCRKSEGQERVLSLVHTISRTATEGALVRLIKATLPEVRLVAKMLREGTRRMSPAALARHATNGGATNGIDAGFWALSFIGVPTPNPEKYSMSDQEFVDAGMIPCSCGCDSPGLHSCSGCRGAVYKDKDCQRRHWKEHKLVCSRNGKERDTAGAGGGREGGAMPSPRLASSALPQGPSILIDLTIDDHYIPEGMVLSTIALNPGGVHNSQLRGSGGVAPLNRHGSARFIVKAQAPLEGHHMLIYDDSKGLHHFIIKWRAPQLLEAIGKEPTWGGLKAYFYAVREGDSLRVFTGEFAPTQGW